MSTAFTVSPEITIRSNAANIKTLIGFVYTHRKYSNYIVYAWCLPDGCNGLGHEQPSAKRECGVFGSTGTQASNRMRWNDLKAIIHSNAFCFRFASITCRRVKDSADDFRSKFRVSNAIYPFICWMILAIRAQDIRRHCVTYCSFICIKWISSFFFCVDKLIEFDDRPFQMKQKITLCWRKSETHSLSENDLLVITRAADKSRLPLTWQLYKLSIAPHFRIAARIETHSKWKIFPHFSRNCFPIFASLVWHRSLTAFSTKHEPTNNSPKINSLWDEGQLNALSSLFAVRSSHRCAGAPPSKPNSQTKAKTCSKDASTTKISV